jgi:hypothetical protein
MRAQAHRLKMTGYCPHSVEVSELPDSYIIHGTCCKFSTGKYQATVLKQGTAPSLLSANRMTK